MITSLILGTLGNLDILGILDILGNLDILGIFKVRYESTINFIRRDVV